ncbi:SMC-Scp complex subunit ScpB [Patescibacteria group bacterium]|nr:SMC-Scp complex subunit ScpB [Patescibacteria group bacterium]MBU1500944.1 SMC-Scp complex subunit ScpB [Patescibacteria group bacterium]MBU2080574.1 SMC-Scp complex subunit ScpB [Patescibacteria group bacterium]MBU2124350.1 SMC-Scp complex subunit ScpB [Patescibacteria group bacterium]MBU2194476.1 SMC-Scp complex subunit ScpB [Patescibacteria group bacterium]
MALALSSRLEALLFASGEPMAKTRLATLLNASPESIDDALRALTLALADRGLTLVQTGRDVELRTAADAAEDIKQLRESELSRDLGKASLETLAFILYRGTATRGEIDWVRGVNSSAAVRSLLLRGLIERTEDPEDKRRARYQPTIDALAHLGVQAKEELPRYAELSRALAEHQAKTEETEL